MLGAHGRGGAGAAACRTGGPARRAGAGQSRQAASEAGLRSDRRLAARRRPRQPVPLLAAGRLQADAGGAGALRRRAQGAGRRQGLPRRHRTVLARGPAADHDARLADRDDAVSDRDLHGQRVHEQPARRLSRRPHAFRSRTSSSAAGMASRSAAGRATRWSSTPVTSSAITTGSTPGFPPAMPCGSSSGCG